MKSVFNKPLLLTTALMFGVSFVPSQLVSEVTSRPCPYSCRTLGLHHDHCKDWKEGDLCFVDDMHPSSTQPAANWERKVVMVNKTILAGEKTEVKLPHNQPIDHFDIVLRREGGSTETQLSVSLGEGIALGSKQIDQNVNHVVQFAANGTRPEGRRLELVAISGDIFVESVHVLSK